MLGDEARKPTEKMGPNRSAVILVGFEHNKKRQSEEQVNEVRGEG